MLLSENELYKNEIKLIDKYNLKFDKLKNNKILISGGTGLLGTVLVDILDYINSKYSLNLELFLITRNKEKTLKKYNYVSKTKISIVEHDINNPFDTEEIYDLIVHGASNTHPLQYAQDPVGCLTTNVIGTNNLLKIAKKNKNCRFVLLSSVEIYGEDFSKLEKGFSEKDFGYLDCNTVRANYCEGKRASESLCQAYKSQYNVDVVIARLCRCYGPTVRMDDSKAINQFIKNGLNAENIVLKSDGSQLYSFIYALDAVVALLHIIIFGENGEAYNISDNNSNITLKELAEIISNKCNTKVIFDLPSDFESKGYSKATRAILNNEKINGLGWKPIYNIKTGIENTIDIMMDIL